MKKVILCLTVVMLVLTVFATTVNAASVSANKTENAKGEKVTVTVNVDTTHNVDVTLAYDANVFTYESTGTDNSKFVPTVNGETNPGFVYVSGANATETINKVEFTFTAKTNVEGANFTASVLLTENNDTLTSDKVSVKVVDAQVPGTSELGEKPTLLPQTGAPYIIAAIVVIAIIALVVRNKMKK